MAAPALAPTTPFGPRRSERRAPSAWTVAALATLFVAIVAATWERWGTIGSDAGGALYQAAAIAQGAVLYRDLTSPYPPLGAYALAGVFRVFGVHLMAAYALGLVLLGVESCLMWIVLRRLLPEPHAAIALAAFWVLEAFQPELFNWVLPNVYASPCAVVFATAVVALLVADADRPRPTLLAWASLCTALAGLSKLEHGAAAYATVVAYCVCIRPERRARTIARDLAIATLPGALFTAAVAGVFMHAVPWRQLLFDNVYRIRSLGPAVAAYGRFIAMPLLPVYAAAARSYLLELPLRVAAVTLGAWWIREAGVRRLAGAALVAVALALPFVGGTPENPDLYTTLSQSQFGWTPPVWAFIAIAAFVSPRRVPAALAIVAVFSVALTARWGFRVAWSSYYAVFAPGLAVLVVVTVAGAAVGRESPWPVVAVMATWLATAAVNGWPWYAAKEYRLAYPRGVVRTVPGFGSAAASVIDTLRAETRPGDWVAVMPEEQIINFFAETRHPTRDIGLGPEWLATADDVTRYLVELEARAPRFVVTSRRRYPEFGAGSFLQYHPEIARYLHERYTPIRVVARFTILERRPAAAPIGP